MRQVLFAAEVLVSPRRVESVTKSMASAVVVTPEPCRQGDGYEEAAHKARFATTDSASSGFITFRKVLGLVS